MGGTHRQGTKANERTPRGWSGGTGGTGLGATRARGPGNSSEVTGGGWRKSSAEEQPKGTGRGFGSGGSRKGVWGQGHSGRGEKQRGGETWKERNWEQMSCSQDPAPALSPSPWHGGPTLASPGVHSIMAKSRATLSTATFIFLCGAASAG